MSSQPSVPDRSHGNRFVGSRPSTVTGVTGVAAIADSGERTHRPDNSNEVANNANPRLSSGTGNLAAPLGLTRPPLRYRGQEGWVGRPCLQPINLIRKRP